MSPGLKNLMIRFWRQLVCECGCSGTSILSLPDDVILNILTRLPTRSVLQCKLVVSRWNQLSSTPYFAETHLANNLTPQLLVEHRRLLINEGEKNMLLLQGSGKHARFKRAQLKYLKQMFEQGECRFHVFCSCDGVIILNYPRLGNDQYLIYNPITLESFFFREKNHHIFGFFFHELERDYKLLLYKMDSNGLSNYYLYGLKNKDKRLLQSSRYYPMCYRMTLFGKHELAVVVGGYVFWMVWSNSKYVSKLCSESIMMFDMKIEDFFIMPHPGSTCTYCFQGKLHEKMRLLELDGRLSLCHVCANTIEVWILQDVKNWIWEKMYVLKFDHPFNYAELFHAHFIVAIYSGNLLLNWPPQGLFWCNLASNYIWEAKVPFKYDRDQCNFYAVRYTSSFVSFGSGEILSFAADFKQTALYQNMICNR